MVSGSHSGEVIFLPGDPPRRGQLALFDPPTRWGRARLGSVELVRRSGSGVRRVVVSARLVPISQALEWMSTLPAEAGPPASRAAWSVVIKAGVSLVARGRLRPAVTPGGRDCWLAGPLDVADEEWLRRLTRAFPASAYALPLAGSRPLRVRSPEALIRRCWDAVADTLPRTAAAATVNGQPAFASVRPVRVAGWERWLELAPRGPAGGARAGLRLEPPQAAEGKMTAVLQLRSRADPSLVVDAVDLWRSPSVVLRRLGEDAESELLLALRRAALAWAPLGRAISLSRPDRLELVDEEVGQLLGPAAEQLAAAGLELLWPTELTRRLELRARVSTPAPTGGGGGFALADLLDFHFELSLDGDPLTAAEVEQLAEAKRPLVRLRGRWVALEPALLERLRRPSARMRAGEALVAALAGGELEVEGQRVPIELEGGLADLVRRLRMTARPVPAASPQGLRGTLRPYQRRGLAWLGQLCDLGLGGCLADDMGLGKTIQVIALQLSRQRGPLLVVCPASVLGNWERELGRFAPRLAVRRYHGGGRHLAGLAATEVVLATYGVVRRDSSQLAKVAWDLVVADEAQQVKNPLSRGARELRAIGSGIRIALTGTPIENRLSELWSILDWTTPGLLGPLERFQHRIAVPIERYGNVEESVRLAKSVRPFLLRRRKVDPDVAPELPPKTETDYLLPLTEEQATLYEAVVRETLDQIRQSQGIGRRGLVLKLLTGLKQVCNHPAQYLRQPGPLEGRSGKLVALDELLEIITAEDESALVFTQYVAMGRLLESHLRAAGITTLFLHGGVTPRRRDQMVADFQDGGVAVFLLSLRAGGVGLNLTRATHVIHFDRWWNPAVEDQATDRAYRIGQERPVQVHKLLAQGTLEERIAALLERKRHLADAVVGAGEAWLSELSDSELADLVALRRP
ncbi:MAG: DEAD/DEAH box helicase [Candidatus Dormibacteria bacterium]